MAAIWQPVTGSYPVKILIVGNVSSLATVPLLEVYYI